MSPTILSLFRGTKICTTFGFSKFNRCLVKKKVPAQPFAFGQRSNHKARWLKPDQHVKKHAPFFHYSSHYPLSEHRGCSGGLTHPHQNLRTSGVSGPTVSMANKRRCPGQHFSVRLACTSEDWQRKEGVAELWPLSGTKTSIWPKKGFSEQDFWSSTGRSSLQHGSFLMSYPTIQATFLHIFAKIQAIPN